MLYRIKISYIKGETKKSLRGAVQKKPSIFTDIAQIGGREVNPISKKLKEINF